MHHSKLEEPVYGPADALEGRCQASSQSDSRGGVRGASGAPLGITAKSSPPPDRDLGARAARVERYAALAQARSWMGRRVNVFKPEEQFPGNVYRTFDCRHVRTAHFVGLHYRPEYFQAQTSEAMPRRGDRRSSSSSAKLSFRGGFWLWLLLCPAGAGSTISNGGLLCHGGTFSCLASRDRWLEAGPLVPF